MIKVVTAARHLFALSFGGAVLLTGPAANAAVCGSLKPGSCHSLSPNEAQSEGGPPTAFAGYPPLAYNSGSILIEPEDLDGPASNPGLEESASAGVWASEGREPMAAAWLSYSYFPAQGDQYLRQPSSNTFEFECNSAEQPLCYQDGSVLSEAGTLLQRSYRVTQINPATLPKAVESIPFLIDYKIAFFQSGIRERTEGEGNALRGVGSVGFGPFVNVGGGWLFNGHVVDCYYQDSGTTCLLTVPNKGSSAAEGAGTMRVNVSIGALDVLALRITAKIRRYNDPQCRPRNQIEDSPCLVEPWSGSGHMVTDPYVYIDPEWEYASWFQVEMAADETDTTWVVPRRTSIDPETLTVGAAGEGGASGGAGATGAGGANAGGANSGGGANSSGGTSNQTSGGVSNATGGTDATQAGASGSANGGTAGINAPSGGDGDDGCSCHVPARPASSKALWFLMVSGLILGRRLSRRASPGLAE